jgi:hypothetical protein
MRQLFDNTNNRAGGTALVACLDHICLSTKEMNGIQRE